MLLNMHALRCAKPRNQRFVAFEVLRGSAEGFRCYNSTDNKEFTIRMNNEHEPFGE